MHISLYRQLSTLTKVGGITRFDCIVGTVKRNKQFLPKVFKDKKPFALHQSLFGFSQGQRNTSELPDEKELKF